MLGVGELAGATAWTLPLHSGRVVAARLDGRWYLEELFMVPVDGRTGLLATGLRLQECFALRQHLGRRSFTPLLYVLYRLRRVHHSLAVRELGGERARVGNRPGPGVARSQSLRHQGLVYALLLAHQLEQLRNVPVNLPFLHGR